MNMTKRIEQLEKITMLRQGTVRAEDLTDTELEEIIREEYGIEGPFTDDILRKIVEEGQRI